MLSPFLQGLGLGGGLIIAIGAQNAYLLSQGVRRNYPIQIATVCFLCDALLISIGIAGVGTIVASDPALGRLAAWGGATFLGWYGWKSLRSAMTGSTLEAQEQQQQPLRKILLTTLAVTLLNPHTYLDTLVLIGSIGGQFPADQRIFFWAGTMTISCVWFYSLALGARLLSPLFRRPHAWRVLDSLICLIMWSIAGSLLVRDISA